MAQPDENLLREELAAILDQHSTLTPFAFENNLEYWCSCQEGDIRESYPTARDQAIDDIVRMLAEKSFVDL